jgi:SAM-dependent methyltransferase
VAYTRPNVYQDEARKDLQRVFNSLAEEAKIRTVLDAGCGYQLPLDLSENVHLVGLDVSEDALARNENIDEKLLGDIQNYPLAPDYFDAVLCWWVLEHLPHPEQAIGNIARSLTSGGLLVIGVPYFWSLKALLTKATPHRFHVWTYRRILGIATVDKPESDPYPTYLRRVVSPTQLTRAATKEGLSLVYSRTYRSGVEYKLPTILRRIYVVIGQTLTKMSLHRWNPLQTDYIAIFRKT